MSDDSLFELALARLGPLDHDTLYGFVPALWLGGEVRVENLQKLDAHGHLELLSQITARLFFADVGQAVKS